MGKLNWWSMLVLVFLVGAVIGCIFDRAALAQVSAVMCVAMAIMSHHE